MEKRTRIKGIFFDFDGVITKEKNGSPTMIAYISEEMNIPYDKVYNAYVKYNDDLLMGNINHEDMWKAFCTEIGQDIEYDILKESFMNMTLDMQMLDIIREFKENYIIGMITDNKADRIDAIIDNTELKGLFDSVVISAKVHSRKNENQIFLQALKETGLNPQECVFIDNTASNLVAPKNMGFTTVFFDDVKRDYGVIREAVEQNDI